MPGRDYFISISILFSVFLLMFPSLAHAQNVCRFYVFFYNDTRSFEGAPYDAECELSVHTAPWGNLGVDSNIGRRIDGDQFAGWCADGDWAGCKSTSGGGKGDWQWNNCKKDFPPPDPGFYNKNNYNEQQTVRGAEWYATLVEDRLVGSVSCRRFDGSNFIVSNNFMKLWELDPVDGDEKVGQLEYPDLTAKLSCVSTSCGPNQSNIVWPELRWGYNDDPNARIYMWVDAELLEGVAGITNVDEQLLVVQRNKANSGLARRISRAGLWGTPSSSSQTSAHLLSMISVRRAAQSLLAARLVDGITGEPIEDGVIIVTGSSFDTLNTRSVTTDQDGHAVIAIHDLPAELIAFAVGYGRARINVASLTRPLRIPLPEGATVSGAVVDQNGMPVGGATASVEYAPLPPPEPGVEGRLVLGSWHRGRPTTDSGSGSFYILDIDPGVPFWVNVSHLKLGAKTIGPFVLEPGKSLDVTVVLE